MMQVRAGQVRCKKEGVARIEALGNGGQRCCGAYSQERRVAVSCSLERGAAFRDVARGVGEHDIVDVGVFDRYCTVWGVHVRVQCMQRRSCERARARRRTHSLRPAIVRTPPEPDGPLAQRCRPISAN